MGAHNLPQHLLGVMFATWKFLHWKLYKLILQQADEQDSRKQELPDLPSENQTAACLELSIPLLTLWASPRFICSVTTWHKGFGEGAGGKMTTSSAIQLSFLYWCSWCCCFSCLETLLFSSFVHLLNPTNFASILSCKCAHSHTERKSGPAVRGLFFGDQGYSSSFATDCWSHKGR